MNARYWKAGVAVALMVALLSAAYAAANALLRGAPELAGQPVQVDQVEVEFGQGSPYPVHAAIAISLPGPGSQVSQITQTFDGSEFVITVLATSADEGAEAYGTLPYKMWLPLNMAGLNGEYTVTINGVSTSFVFPPPPAGG